MPDFDDGGPAFPCRRILHDKGDSWEETEDGASLADHFAGLAMKQILAAPINAPTPQHAAEQAYRYARAMVAEKRRLEG